MQQKDKDLVEARRWILSKKQIQILNYIAENGTTILEKAYVDLEIPKPTAGYHLQRLENFGLIEPVSPKGRVKPVRLTPLGQSIVKLLQKGETVSYKDRVKISSIGLVVSLGLSMLSKNELKEVVKMFERYIEEGKKPAKEDLRWIV